jgi:hypothetical protein
MQRNECGVLLSASDLTRFAGSRREASAAMVATPADSSFATCPRVMFATR